MGSPPWPNRQAAFPKPLLAAASLQNNEQRHELMAHIANAISGHSSLIHPTVSAFPERVVGSACTSSFSRFHEAMDSDRHSGRVRLLTTYSGGDHAICS